MNTQNLLDFCKPGLYEIYCRKTKRSYFGHSENVMYRLGRHYNDLQAAECHETEELQKDWLEHGQNEFEFRILELGSEWREKNRRVAREQHYFCECKHGLYNRFPPVSANFRKECTIDGITYSSGAEAARQLGVSPSSISRLRKKKKQITFSPQTQSLSSKVFGFKRISIDGQEFSSLTKAMSVLNISKSTLSRRLKSVKYPTWFYIEIEKTRSNDYPERE